MIMFPNSRDFLEYCAINVLHFSFAITSFIYFLKVFPNLTTCWYCTDTQIIILQGSNLLFKSLYLDIIIMTRFLRKTHE